MHRYIKEIYLRNLTAILGGSTLAVISGMMAQTISSDDELTQSLGALSTLVGVVGGIITAIGGTVVCLGQIRVETARRFYAFLAKEDPSSDQILAIRRVIEEGSDAKTQGSHSLK